MDKVYDSEKIHSLIGGKIKSDSISPVKRREQNLGKIQKQAALNL